MNNAAPGWFTVYQHPNEGPLAAVRIGDLISFNDGDVCNAACTERLLAAGVAPICVDIGVDKGWWSTFCLAHAPTAHVYAFEPNPISFPALKEHFAEAIAAGRLTLVPKAVSSSATTLPLWLDGGCSHSRGGSGGGSGPTEPTVVETTTLDFLFEAHPRIDLLKMDTEGHELTILKGLAPHLGKIGSLIFEFTVYWYGTTKAECMSRSYEMLERIMAEFPYVYTFSRRGPPVLTRIESVEDVHQLVHAWYNHHFQTDILATRAQLTLE